MKVKKKTLILFFGVIIFFAISTAVAFQYNNPTIPNISSSSSTSFAPKNILDLFLGDSSDGDVTIMLNATLTREMHYDDLVLNATITTAGRIIRAKTITLNPNGNIAWNGLTGSGSTGVSGGSGGTALGGNQLGGSQAGCTGRAGSLSTASPPSACTSCSNYMGGNGGYNIANGKGGNGQPDYIGGLPNTLSPSSVFYDISTLSNFQSIGTAYVTGGCGGVGAGGGAGDGVGSGGGGGGGGSGAGVIQIYARTIIFNGGSIQARGGRGGAGANGMGGGAGTGGGGGGSGGGGGKIEIFTMEIIGTPVINVTGGVGGAGGNGAGTTPDAGTQGALGSSGTYTIFYLHNGTVTTLQ